MIKKVCGVCNNLDKPIWKAKTRDNPCMCKDCYNAEKSYQKPLIKAREPIKKVSSKQAKINTAYSVLRLQYLKMFPNCQVSSDDCTRIATQVHHRAGRIGNNMLDTTIWLSVCHTCHELIERNPLWAYEKGYSIKRLNKKKMEEQEDNFVIEFPSSIPSVIELTDSQLELIKSIGNHFYNSQETYYSLPFWFKHIEGNKFEMILNTKFEMILNTKKD